MSKAKRKKNHSSFSFSDLLKLAVEGAAFCHAAATTCIVSGFEEDLLREGAGISILYTFLRRL